VGPIEETLAQLIAAVEAGAVKLGVDWAAKPVKVEGPADF
jgi:hypothetical protein